MQSRLTYIIFLLISVISYGQVNLSVTPDKTTYTARDVINLTIVLEIEGSEYNSQQTKLRLPDFKIQSHWHRFHNEWFYGSGDQHRNFSICYPACLRAETKGKLKIGSFLITINNKIYKTEPFDILIKDVDKKLLSQRVPQKMFI